LRVHLEVLAVMQEIGIDLSSERRLRPTVYSKNFRSGLVPVSAT
jgi:hypothetical protein